MEFMTSFYATAWPPKIYYAAYPSVSLGNLPSRSTNVLGTQVQNGKHSHFKKEWTQTDESLNKS